MKVITKIKSVPANLPKLIPKNLLVKNKRESLFYWVIVDAISGTLFCHKLNLNNNETNSYFWDMSQGEWRKIKHFPLNCIIRCINMKDDSGSFTAIIRNLSTHDIYQGLISNDGDFINRTNGHAK